MSGSKLVADTLLRRASGVKLRLLSNRRVEVEARHGTCSVSSLALPVLHAFADPRPMRDIPAGTGAAAWMEWVATVHSLFDIGALEDADSPAEPAQASGFDKMGIHVAMLKDRTRTAAYLDAIARVVRSGDVVVDLGTGTGILALAAARAGARRVFAIEAGRVADVAQRMFDANGFGDVVQLVRGLSTSVSLPEKANVLVSEIIGNEPLGEHVLEYTVDARKRLLEDGARMIPESVQILVQPVTVPDSEQANRRLFPGDADEWSAWYGFDFSPVAGVAKSEAVEFRADPGPTEQWPALGDFVVAADIDLARVTSPVVDTQVDLPISRGGLFNGVTVRFGLDLCAGVRLTNAPASADCSWQTWVCLLDDAHRVQPGDRFRLRYTNAARMPRVSVERR
jgi:SAM-dependent methyltransferase